MNSEFHFNPLTATKLKTVWQPNNIYLVTFYVILRKYFIINFNIKLFQTAAEFTDYTEIAFELSKLICDMNINNVKSQLRINIFYIEINLLKHVLCQIKLNLDKCCIHF